jgi:hypothetical protein
MGVPQDNKTRARQKRRRTKKLAAWRAKQEAKAATPAAAPKKGA